MIYGLIGQETFYLSCQRDLLMEFVMSLCQILFLYLLYIDVDRSGTIFAIIQIMNELCRDM